MDLRSCLCTFMALFTWGENTKSRFIKKKAEVRKCNGRDSNSIQRTFSFGSQIGIPYSHLCHSFFLSINSRDYNVWASTGVHLCLKSFHTVETQKHQSECFWTSSHSPSLLTSSSKVSWLLAQLKNTQNMDILSHTKRVYIHKPFFILTTKPITVPNYIHYNASKKKEKIIKSYNNYNITNTKRLQ